MSQHHGHHMDGSSDGAFHRSFDDAEKWAKEFDKPERDAWQKPEEVIDALRLDRASSVADVGAGTGYFSMKIAKRIPEGKLFAADVEPDMVRYLSSARNASMLKTLCLCRRMRMPQTSPSPSTSFLWWTPIITSETGSRISPS